MIVDINENIKDFRFKGIIEMFWQYIKTCPLITQNATLQVNSATMSSTVGKPMVYAKNRWTTTKEGLIELQRQLDDLRNYISDVEKENADGISRVNSKIDTVTTKSNTQVQEVSTRLEKTVIGNIQYQLLGVLLLLYGAVVNIIQSLQV